MTHPFKTIKYQFYLFQLENYDLPRYWRLIRRTFGFPRRTAPRKKSVWTAKAIILFIVALLFQLFIAVSIASVFASSTVQILVGVILFTVFCFYFFIFLILATILLWPIDYILKRIIIFAAQRKIGKFSNLKIIGITGSYGKTTMKEILSQVLGQDGKILKTPENINTPLGIGRFILKELRSETEVFIVEMGAYKRGDIKELCDLVHPDIAILTGINESHLERFRSLENTIRAKFEIVENAKPAALVVLNADDKLVMENYKNYTSNKKALFYSSTKSSFFEDGSGIEFEIKLRGSGGELPLYFRIPLLGEYIVGMVMGCILIAEELGLSQDKIKQGILQIKPIPHRLEPIFNPNDILVIDDSYNGNPDGVDEAIRVLGKFKNRRKIYVTPGLVEMGRKTQEIHWEIGKKLSQVADFVILIKNSASPFIADGLLQSGYSQDKIIWFDSAVAAYNSMAQILKPRDVVLFQNDWPDNYF